MSCICRFSSTKILLACISLHYKAQLPKEAQEYLDVMSQGVIKMKQLLAGLLQYSSLVSDREELNDDSDLNLVLKEVLYRQQALIETKKATIDLVSSLPIVKMRYAHSLLLLESIIENALKFSTAPAQISIHATATLICISDKG